LGVTIKQKAERWEEQRVNQELSDLGARLVPVRSLPQNPYMTRFFVSVAVGAGAAVATGAVAFALTPFFDAMGVYFAPAQLLLPVVGTLIPARVMDWLVPNGGPSAGVLLVLACALLFWTVVFGAAHRVWSLLKRKTASVDRIESQ
jgi:hypothetical protein